MVVVKDKGEFEGMLILEFGYVYSAEKGIDYEGCFRCVVLSEEEMERRIEEFKEKLKKLLREVAKVNPSREGDK